MAVIGEFLGQTPLSASERSDILDAVKHRARDFKSTRREWVLTGDSLVYAIALRPVQADNRAGVQAKLEEAARKSAALRAHYLLYLRAVSERRKARYADEESVANVLSEWDGRRDESMRLKPNLSVALVSKKWAFALLRIELDRLEALGEQIDALPEKTIDESYCAALYPKAKAFFDQGEYEKALPVYLELHKLRWARPTAYLDAAECYLRTGDRESAARLAAETASELDGSMNSLLTERAGDILSESGKDDAALELYIKAAQKLQNEP